MRPLRQSESSSEAGSSFIHSPAPEAAPAPSRRPRDRQIGLRRTRADAYRVYAILVIVWAHCELALDPPSGGYLYVGYALSIVGHAAVPFFLFIAGNHLGARIALKPDVETVRPYLARLVRLVFVWSAIYFVHGALAFDKSPSFASFGRYAHRLLADPVALVLHGTSPHLWFLVALAFSVVLCTVVLRHARLRQLLLIAAVLYGLGLVAGPYGYADYTWDVRMTQARILQTSLFFGLGIILSRRQVLLPRRVGWLLIGMGGAIQAVETFVFVRAGFDPFLLGMLVGTVPLAAGIGVLALHPGATWLDRRMAPLATLVPFVYLSHIIFMDLLRPHRLGDDTGPYRLLFTLMVASAAFAAAWLLRAVGRRWRTVPGLLTGGRFGAFA